MNSWVRLVSAIVVIVVCIICIVQLPVVPPDWTIIAANCAYGL
jgi:hypothetical protein